MLLAGLDISGREKDTESPEPEPAPEPVQELAPALEPFLLPSILSPATDPGIELEIVSPDMAYLAQEMHTINNTQLKSKSMRKHSRERQIMIA